MMSKPNVLIYSSNSTYHKNDYGGAEKSLHLIGEKLVQKGIKVVYFTNGITRIPGIKKQKINGVMVYFFTPWRWPLLNNRILPLLAKKLIRKQKDKALAGIIKKKKIAIVHTYDISDTLDVIKIREQHQLKFKIVLRMAGLYWVTQLKFDWLKPAAIEYTFNNIDIMNFLDQGFERFFNESCKKHGIKFSAPQKLIQDIGVDCSYYQPRKEPPKNRNFTIVCSARFCDYAKRQDLLINALKKIKNQNIHIAFAGDGETLERYKARVTNAGLDHKVTFHGYVPTKELKDILKKADLLALPTDYEGVSKAVIEAMAMKIPVLVSDVPALNSFITDQKTGFLVKNNAENWAETILKLSNDRKLLSKVADAGYLLARKKYNADINIIKYIEAFQNL